LKTTPITPTKSPAGKKLRIANKESKGACCLHLHYRKQGEVEFYDLIQQTVVRLMERKKLLKVLMAASMEKKSAGGSLRSG